MRQRDEVLSNLSAEQIISTLEACSLEDKQEFTEDEVARIEYCRSLVEQQGKSYKQATAQIRRQDKLPQHKSETEPETQLLDISELLALASKQCETRITLTEVIQILDICGLSGKDEYSSLEGDRFLEACALVKRQSKSYEEVAAHFGVDSADDCIEDGIDEAAVALEQSGNGVISEVMRHKAKVDASVAASMYLKHLAMEFGSPEFQQEWHQMEQMLKAKVVGKSQVRARQVLGEIRMMPRSPLPLKASPEVLED